MEERGDKFAVLRNPEGFLLTLMHDKRMTPEQGYPGLFHVGFLQSTQQAVDRMHDALSDSQLHGSKTRATPAGWTAHLRLLLRRSWRGDGGGKYDELRRSFLTPSGRYWVYILFFRGDDRALVIEDVPPMGGALPDRGASGDTLTLA